MLKILGMVDEFRESGVTCKNLDTEAKNLANDNTLLQIFNAFNELKNTVNQKETLNVKHCNEIKGEVARVSRGLAEVTKGYQQQQQQGSPGNSLSASSSPVSATKVGVRTNRTQLAFFRSLIDITLSPNLQDLAPHLLLMNLILTFPNQARENLGQDHGDCGGHQEDVAR